MPVRSYIFTRREKERLLRWLEEGFEDDTTRMIFVEIRRNMPRLFRDLTLMLRVMREASAARAESLLREAEEIEGLKLIIESERTPLNYLIEVGNALAEREPNVVAILLSEIDGRFIVKAGDRAVERGVHAGRLARALAKVIGGGGGGKPHFAQGGGGNPSKLEEAEEAIREALRGQLGPGGNPV